MSLRVWTLLWVSVAVGCGGGPPAPGSWLRPRHYSPRTPAAAVAPAPRLAPRRPRPLDLVVQVQVRETWVRRAPSTRARHRGVVRRGARLRSLGIVHGRGCPLGWHRLAVGGYLCGDEVRVTSALPGGPRHPRLRPGARLPYRYVAVRAEGSGEYLKPEDAASDYFLRELAPRNALTVADRLRVDGEWFWRTTRGTYVPGSEVVPLGASRFAGQALRGRWQLPVAFVLPRRAPLYRSPGRLGGGWLSRYHRAPVLPPAAGRGGRYLALGAHQWVRRSDVRLAVRTPPPPGVGPREPWIDVDVAEQVLVAYRGPRPVYATLVSTGRHGKTPLGTFRVWVKLAATDMRSGPREAGRPYQLWDVPWTVFFKGDFGLHGTYWHDRFGHRKSAGCVNLSPADARWIFQFTAPALPAGWWAVLPLRPGDGSVIRIRDGRKRPRRPPRGRKR